MKGEEEGGNEKRESWKWEGREIGEDQKIGKGGGYGVDYS